MFDKILSVLVVDDELPLREELRLIEWEKYGTVLIGEAENGKEALKLCEVSLPDIIITDIQMPLMDGLKFTKIIKEKYSQIQVILLTNHSEFQFARNALQYGALDYLIKVTLEESDIKQVIHKARNVIEREQNHMIRLKWSQALIINNMISSSVKDLKICVEKLKGKGLNIKFPQRLARLFTGMKSKNRIFIDNELERKLLEFEQNGKNNMQWIPISNGDYIIFFEDQQVNTAILLERLQNIVSALNNTLEHHAAYTSEEISVFAVISDTIKDKTQFGQTLGFSEKWSDFHFYSEQNNLIITNFPIYTSLIDSLTVEIEDKISLVEGDSEQLLQFMQKDFYEWGLKHLIHPSDIKHLLIKWVIDWQNKLIIRNKYNFIETINKTNSFTGLLAVMIHIIQQNTGKKHAYRHEIRKAIEMIQHELAEPLTLSHIADNVGLSNHYLSRLFRQELGESFNEYITRLRMEKAITLLDHSNLKIYEVAEKVGIPSYRYFSIIFRKWTGLTPTDYKRGKGL